MPFRSYLIRLLVLAAAPAAALSTAAAAPAPAPVAPNALAHGKATFERLCSGCHDLALATDTRRTRGEWVDLVDRMYLYGVSGTEAERKEIVDYLAAAYGPS